MCGETDKNIAVVHEQTGPLIFPLIAKRNVASAVASTWDCGGQLNRSTEFFRTGGDIEGVQAGRILTVLFGLGDYVQSVRSWIDSRRAGNANFRNDIASAHIAIGDRGGSVDQKV